MARKLLCNFGMNSRFSPALRMLAIGVCFATKAVALPPGTAALCPVQLLLELARQTVPAQRHYRGAPLPAETRLPAGSDARLLGLDAAAREIAVASFVGHFGESVLRGIFLVGSKSTGRPGDELRPEPDAVFVVFVSGQETHRDEAERVRADLRDMLGDVPIEVHGMSTRCADCPWHASVPAGPDDESSRFPLIVPPGCPLPLDSANTAEAVRLWP